MLNNHRLVLPNQPLNQPTCCQWAELAGGLSAHTEVAVLTHDWVSRAGVEMNQREGRPLVLVMF